jgi:putative two-component system response regulator
LSLGAIDYITKPFAAPLLLRRVENHIFMFTQKRQLEEFNENLDRLVEEKTSEARELQDIVLSTVADLVEFRDEVTGAHAGRMQQFLKVLLDAMVESNVYGEQIATWGREHIMLSAQLHDVGKIAIGDQILNKPGRLTPEEFDVMKTHTSIGVKIIRQIEEKSQNQTFLKHARFIAGSHHEKWDGSGYPTGLKQDDIPLEGRIMAIVDVYDALVSKRPYKPPFSTDEAKKIILEGRDTHFDPALVDLFETVADQFKEIVKEQLAGC